MARATTDMELGPVIDAAQQWVKKCLIEDRSIFSTTALWTAENVAEVRAAFVDHPDTGSENFKTKLKGQMESASSAAKQLMAEMIWVLLLFPSNIKIATKRDQVRGIWSTSGDDLAETHPMLSGAVLSGIGGAGPGFNNHRWRELTFLIDVATELKQRPESERQQRLSDYEKFIEWIEGVPRDGQRQFRHMLRYLLFPDRVERMASNRHRRAILSSFEVAPEEETKRWSDRQLDDALVDLRKKLEGETPGQILDFYRPPLVDRWLPKEPSPITPESVANVLRRYHDEQIIFNSAAQKRRYAIAEYDVDGVSVERIDASEPQRVTFAQAEKLIEQVKAAGSLEFAALDNTSAVRATVLQAEPLALTADQTRVVFLPDNGARLQNFLQVLDNLNMANPLYKPAMLACVLDGIESGELVDNRITFDWVAPRFIAKLSELGKSVTEREAAQPFYHLTGDLIWLHAVADRADLMREGSDGPVAAREKVKYALLKDTYWNMLQEPAVT